MDKHIIVWLEDRPETAPDFLSYCQDLGIQVKIIGTDYALLDFLKKSKDSICLIIVDIMLFAVCDLEGVGVSGVNTEEGYNAGWAIIDHLLRPKDKEAPFPHIPLIILSSRILTEGDLIRLQIINDRSQAMGLSQIKYYVKIGINHEGITWNSDYPKLINELCCKKP